MQASLPCAIRPICSFAAIRSCIGQIRSMLCRRPTLGAAVRRQGRDTRAREPRDVGGRVESRESKSQTGSPLPDGGRPDGLNEQAEGSQVSRRLDRSVVASQDDGYDGRRQRILWESEQQSESGNVGGEGAAEGRSLGGAHQVHGL